jgi:cytochrome c-type biogenesis protein CcmF
VINFINRDFYVSPVSIDSPEEAGERAVTLDKGSSVEIGGLSVRFVSFDFSDEAREAMMEGKDFVISANLEISEGKMSRPVALRMVSSPTGPNFIPERYEAADGRVFVFTLARIVPSESQDVASRVEFKVKLPADKSTAKREETLVIEASVKPMINLVWMGTVTLVVGFLLTIIRRAEEARSASDRWRRT